MISLNQVKDIEKNLKEKQYEILGNAILCYEHLDMRKIYSELLKVELENAICVEETFTHGEAAKMLINSISAGDAIFELLKS